MIQLIGNKWDEVLAEEYQKEYFKKIILYINSQIQEKRKSKEEN